MRSTVWVVRAAACAGALAALGTFGSGAHGAGATGSRTSITVWSGAASAQQQQMVNAYGGVTYGGLVEPAGALVIEQRDVDVAADGEVHVPGVAATLDPGSVQLRSLTDPQAIVSEQRFVPGATTPTEILAHHVGQNITLATAKGEIAGVLRAVDEQTLVVEVGVGDQRHLQLVRRDFVQDVRLPPGGALDKPTLSWRLATKKPGKQAVEIAYRADGMSWAADYLAVLDDNGSVDFSAWATIKNGTGAAFDDAEVTLVGGGAAPSLTAAQIQAGLTPATGGLRAVGSQSRYVLPGHLRLGAGESVQVELVPPRSNVKPKSEVVIDTMPGTLDEATPGQPQFDCSTLFNGGAMPTARIDSAIEIDIPTQVPLPDGKVRLFRRGTTNGHTHLEVVSEDELRSAAGAARIAINSADGDVTATRNQDTCNYDDARHRLEERIEVEVESTAARPLDVVVHETMWRWTTWKVEASNETVKGMKAGPQFQDYRVHLGPKEKKSIGYTVVYTQ